MYQLQRDITPQFARKCTTYEALRGKSCYVTKSSFGEKRIFIKKRNLKIRKSIYPKYFLIFLII